jgi:hypothetical protein
MTEMLTVTSAESVRDMLTPSVAFRDVLVEVDSGADCAADCSGQLPG